MMECYRKDCGRGFEETSSLVGPGAQYRFCMGAVIVSLFGAPFPRLLFRLHADRIIDHAIRLIERFKRQGDGRVFIGIMNEAGHDGGGWAPSLTLTASELDPVVVKPDPGPCDDVGGESYEPRIPIVV